ncbi:MAG: phosphoribosyl-ATP diphosphatase [Spirochaetales bacterium]|nr:phosphoribosyl-ATP diphosphatase [Spirochaetales bacterium]
MLIPSIDIMGGRAVQLVGGAGAPLDCGDPLEIATRFSRVGPVAVVDLDAALGRGSNRPLVLELVKRHDCVVGGGVRTEDDARALLDSGALRVVIGTAASPDFLARLPRERVMVALDARDGEVLDSGWTRGTGETVEERLRRLAPYAGGFLLTMVESEGSLRGIDLGRCEALAAAARDAGFEGRLVFAGGVTTGAEIAALDRLGADAQVGMALYSGRLGLAEAFAAPLVSERQDGLWPTVVRDERGLSLGLAWSDAESLREALETGAGVYRSRKRGLWRKGASSGNRQVLLRVEADCDRDALAFTVRQEGTGFCHLGTRSCFGTDGGLSLLERTVIGRITAAPEGSYTRRLLEEEGLLAAKLVEEAGELAEAESAERAAEEAADLFYFALVALAAAGGRLSEVERVLDRRARKLTRRPGDAKPAQAGKGAACPAGIH